MQFFRYGIINNLSYTHFLVLYQTIQTCKWFPYVLASVGFIIEICNIFPTITLKLLELISSWVCDIVRISLIDPRFEKLFGNSICKKNCNKKLKLHKNIHINTSSPRTKTKFVTSLLFFWHRTRYRWHRHLETFVFVSISTKNINIFELEPTVIAKRKKFYQLFYCFFRTLCSMKSYLKS